MEVGCPSCGYENPLAARFCSSCGTQLRAASPAGGDATIAFDPMLEGETSAIDVATDLPEGTQAMLVVRQGPKRGTRIALDNDEVTIGRHPGSDIFLDDVTVSRHHATIRRAERSFQVLDAGSLNGTYVNQSRVDEAELNDGDELQIGKFKLVYLAIDGSAVAHQQG